MSKWVLGGAMAAGAVGWGLIGAAAYGLQVVNTVVNTAWNGMGWPDLW